MILLYSETWKKKISKKIIKIELNEVIKNIRENKMDLVLDESAEEFIADKGFDPKFGARPLKRAIQKYVEDALAEEILIGTFKEGSKNSNKA